MTAGPAAYTGGGRPSHRLSQLDDIGRVALRLAAPLPVENSAPMAPPESTGANEWQI